MSADGPDPPATRPLLRHLGVRLRVFLLALAAVSLLQVLLLRSLGRTVIERYLCARCGAMRTVRRFPTLAVFGREADERVEETCCSRLLREMRSTPCGLHEWLLVDRRLDGELRAQGPMWRVERRLRALGDVAVDRLLALASASSHDALAALANVLLVPSLPGHPFLDAIETNTRTCAILHWRSRWFLDEPRLDRLLADLGTGEMDEVGFSDQTSRLVEIRVSSPWPEGATPPRDARGGAWRLGLTPGMGAAGTRSRPFAIDPIVPAPRGA